MLWISRLLEERRERRRTVMREAEQRRAYWAPESQACRGGNCSKFP